MTSKKFVAPPQRVWLARFQFIPTIVVLTAVVIITMCVVTLWRASQDQLVEDVRSDIELISNASPHNG